MSREHPETVKCPNCGAELNMIVWESLNAEISPEANEQLLAGSLFTAACEKCGKSFNLDYPILYHNMTHRVMIQYVQTRDQMDSYLRSMKDAAEKTNKMFPKDKPLENYTQRIVTSQNALREKAIIFSRGLDDRIIEMIKVIYLSEFQKDRPTEKFRNLYFWADPDGSCSFQYLMENGKTASAAMQQELYDIIRKDFIGVAEKKSKDCFVIDWKWAAHVFD